MIINTVAMHQITPDQHNLQHSFDATIGTSFDTSVTPDVFQQLLADKRSPNTRRAYENRSKDQHEVTALLDELV